MTSSPNTNPLTYNGYVTALSTMAVVQATDVNFLSLLPQALNYAELRIQRDLNLLALQYENDAYVLASGSNLIHLSVDDFVTVQSIAATVGTRKIQLAPASKEYIQSVWDDSSVSGPPVNFAPLGGDAATGGAATVDFLFGPYADAAYPLSIVGTNRAPSLNLFAGTPQATSGLTFISTFLPDLLLMASMIFISGYQRNFSATSDDPAMPVNYEKQYQALVQGAQGEELRKRWSASGWTSMASAPTATPART